MHSVFLRCDDDVRHLLLSVSKKGLLLNMHVADSAFPAFPASTNQLIFRALEQKAFTPVTWGATLWPLPSSVTVSYEENDRLTSIIIVSLHTIFVTTDGSSVLDVTFLKTPCFWSYFYKDCLKMEHVTLCTHSRVNKKSVIVCWKKSF